MNIVIFGGGSFLGSSFLNYLKINNEHSVLNISSLKQKNAYSIENLTNLLSKYKPDVIIDYKFLDVGASDDFYKDLSYEYIFSPQLNLINVLEKLKINPKLFIISTNLIDRKTIKNNYIELKKKHEDLYKSTKKLKNINILRFDSILGYGDFNDNRLIPFFFKKISKNQFVEFKSSGEEHMKISLVNDLNIYLYEKLNNNSFFLESYKVMPFEIINYISDILISKYSLKVKTSWDDKFVDDFSLDNKKLEDQLEQITNSYLKKYNII